MRVISGKFKGKKLILPDAQTTRPLRDFVKENIFNLIMHSKEIKFNFRNSNICDLFAGSGSFGIERLSRDAKHVTFVEQNKNVLKILKNNILKIESQLNCEIIENDVLHFLTTRKLGVNFNLIFIDPPYQFKKVDEIFKLITNNFRSNIIVFHTHVKNKLILPDKINILIDKTYGISRIMFLKN